MYPVDRYEELIAVFRGEGGLREPLQAEIRGKGKPTQVERGMPVPYIQTATCQALLATGLTGFSAQSFTAKDVSRARERDEEECCFLSVTGRCESLFPTRQRHLRILTRERPGVTYHAYQGLPSPPAGWSGHDVFLALDSHAIGVTETFRLAWRALGVKGFRFESLNDVDSMWASSLEKLAAG